MNVQVPVFSMKRILLVTVLLVCAAWGATSIKWTWNDHSILKLHAVDSTLQLGLRSDGVVVWREITNTTNSPSEKEWIYFYGVPTEDYKWTNIILTNLNLFGR